MTNSGSAETTVQNHDEGGGKMATTEKMNPNKVARIAALLYIPAWILSLVAMFLRQSLIVSGDAATTANNIMASRFVFSLSVVLDLIVQVVFIFLVLALYKLLKPVNRTQAAVMVILFLVSVPIAMLNAVSHFAALLLASGPGYLAAFPAEQVHALVPFFLELNEIGIYIAYIFWGLWLFPLGYLVFKSGFLPRILGILLMISCFGYLIDFVTFFFFPDFGVSINMLTGWAELILCLWLLIKGVNVKEWEKRALASA
jgi:hypothetical protein